MSYDAKLDKRDVQIVELSQADYDRADEWARKSHWQDFNETSTDENGRRGDATQQYDHAMGAQGEIAAGRVLGVCVPLNVNTFGRVPDIPPHWWVTTQASNSLTMRKRDLRLRPSRDLGAGRRIILVERDVALDGHYVFIVHGWITSERAREVGREKYFGSSNLFVSIRHLTPLESLSQCLDAESGGIYAGLEERAYAALERWQ